MNPVTSSTFPLDDEEGMMIYSPPTRPLTRDEQLGSMGMGIVVMLMLVVILMINNKEDEK